MASYKEGMPAEWSLERKVEYAELLRRSYPDFVKYMWDTVEPGKKLQWSWHLDAICQRLQEVAEGKIKNLVICVPPGTAKSSMTSVFYDPWVWLTNPEEKTLVASVDLAVVVRDNVKARRVIQSEKYLELRNMLTLLGHVPWDFTPDQNQKQYYENTRSGFRQGVTVNGNSTGKRGDKRVTDDPHKILDLLNATPERQSELVLAVTEWYNNVFNSRLNDLTTGKSILIMQRVHEEDLASYCLKDPDYTSLVLPMLFDPDIADPLDPRTEAGELLFPGLFPQPVIDKLRRHMLPDQWEAQYQQRPIPAKGGLIKKEWCTNRYRFAPDWRSNRALPSLRRLLVSMDTANKAKKLNDPSVFGLWGEDDGGNLFLLDIMKERLEYADLEPKAVGYLRTQNPHCTVIEDAASGAQLLSVLPRLGFRVMGEQPFQDKHVRMAVQTSWFQTGKIWLPDDDCPWILEYLLELWRFPQVKHDDQVDMTSQALKWFFENQIAVFEYRISSGVGYGEEQHEGAEPAEDVWGVPRGNSAESLIARLLA